MHIFRLELSIRPPVEETMHEHWKNAARLAPSERRDRSNFIAHVENNFASLQRISLLHEFPVTHQGVRYVGMCESSQFPILFINGNFINGEVRANLNGGELDIEPSLRNDSQ